MGFKRDQLPLVYIKIILNQLHIYPKPYLILIDFFASDICF